MFSGTRTAQFSIMVSLTDLQDKLRDWMYGEKDPTAVLMEIQDRALKEKRQDLIDEELKHRSTKKKVIASQEEMDEFFPSVILESVQAQAGIQDGVNYDIADDRPDFVRQDEIGWSDNPWGF